jgi:hypothetical protein
LTRKPHDATLAFAQAPVALRSQHRLDEAVRRRPCFHPQLYLPVALGELLHLGQRQPFQVFHGEFHSPAAWTLPSSRFQAHPALESNSTFRLITHWKTLTIDSRRQPRLT